jgi:hypothetical protein
MKWLSIAFLIGAGCTGVDGPAACDPAAAKSTCFDGYVCDDSTKQCLRTCQDQSQCLSSQFCDVPTGQVEGVCRFGGLPGGDPGGGDSDGGDPSGDPGGTE